MSKILKEIIGQKCKIIILGMNDITGTILDFDDEWIRFQYSKKEKVKLIRRRFVSSIIIL